jgi:hypothetical protein
LILYAALLDFGNKCVSLSASLDFPVINGGLFASNLYKITRKNIDLKGLAQAV